MIFYILSFLIHSSPEVSAQGSEYILQIDRTIQSQGIVDWLQTRTEGSVGPPFAPWMQELVAPWGCHLISLHFNKPVIFLFDLLNSSFQQKRNCHCFRNAQHPIPDMKISCLCPDGCLSLQYFQHIGDSPSEKNCLQRHQLFCVPRNGFASWVIYLPRCCHETL